MKKFSVFFILIIFIMGFAGMAGADVIEYPYGGNSEYEDEYDQSEWTTIAERSPAEDLYHGLYVIWGLPDQEADYFIETINIVFHNITDSTNGPNWLSVSLFDDPTTMGWSMWENEDGSDPDIPDWENGAYGATLLGTWSDTNGRDVTNDVLFTISDPVVLNYIQDGDTFAIAIDPDCHFAMDEITVQIPAVPEPATMMLFGSGLIGFAFVGRKKLFHRG